MPYSHIYITITSSDDAAAALPNQKADAAAAVAAVPAKRLFLDPAAHPGQTHQAHLPFLGGRWPHDLRPQPLPEETRPQHIWAAQRAEGRGLPGEEDHNK